MGFCVLYLFWKYIEYSLFCTQKYGDKLPLGNGSFTIVLNIEGIKTENKVNNENRVNDSLLRILKQFGTTFDHLGIVKNVNLVTEFYKL